MKKYGVFAMLLALLFFVGACGSGARNAQRDDRQAQRAATGASDGGSATGVAPGDVQVPAVQMDRSQQSVPYGEDDAAPFEGGEHYAAIREIGFLSPLDRPLSTFSADVDTAAYTNIRRVIENRQWLDPDMVRAEEMINYFDYDYPTPAGGSPIAIATELGDCPWNPDNKLALIGLKAADIPTEHLPASNLVFLIDVSGSMSDDNKLPLVKRAFALLIDQLGEQDRVSIVTYAASDQVALYGARGDEKAAIQRAIEDLSAGGSTHASQGIATAYQIARELFRQGGNNRIILATDGDFNVGVTGEDELRALIERERDGGVYLTVLGFGMGNYKDSKVEVLAKNGNGNYAYVDNLQAARKVLVEELGATMSIVAKDVKLQVEFNPQNVAAYRLIGYEHRMLRDEDFRDDAKDAGDMGAGHTVTALYEIVPSGGASGAVPALKYQDGGQKEAQRPGGEYADELLTVRVRYKHPASDAADEIAAVLGADGDSAPSKNLVQAGAVAEFALILRDSPYKGDASIQSVLDALAPLAVQDEYGYVRDLQSLVIAYDHGRER